MSIKLKHYISLLLILIMSGSAVAEVGDYNFWQTLRNLVNPRSADNPVNDQQRLPPYPLLSNPQGFNDGFRPRNYLAWQTIQLHPNTGAICGDGSPYKFFVNRVAQTSNTIVYLEGGGACWDYPSCSGQDGIRGARNPNGVPNDYMSLLNPGASLVSPLVFRLHPWTRTKSQQWNMVYVPYCTGDIYSGDRIAIYQDSSGENDPLVWHHNGAKNLRAVTAWLKNNLQRPGQVLMTGCSAGGTGTLVNYASFREDMAPIKSFLLNDSGPIFPAPENGSDQDYPSQRLYSQIRDVWGLDDGPIPFIQQKLPGFDPNNLVTIYRGLAEKFTHDRIGHTHFWEDLNYSSYSYERFYPEIENETNQELKEQKIHDKWYQDTTNLIGELNTFSNVGYYMPRFRDVNESHCTTIIEFANSDIQEDGLELGHFVNNLLDGNGPVLKASEEDKVSDFQKPFNLLYFLLGQLIL